ncbi:PREDICTED: vomeronasal type-1 receptor 90-like [Galeopterus variegatus]|uniref:Vomeronasal type-1 receptor n=1 Tax=Galeopterus variegatus TaxID=482537 RepID=A0ABM0QS51_GALVR|nr:PREDICTED: vomeronasal type-1 receptor 90-like [Galeopterus variegatus]
MKKNNKLYTFIAMRDTFFSELGIGLLANALLLVFHVLTFLLEHRPKATDLTISHLALIHLVMLLTLGFIATDIFGSQDFWDDIECKAVLYLYRLMRGLSICTTCLLSVLQAITLSPRSSCLAKFKHKCSHHNPCVFLFLWVFYVSINIHLLISTIATPNLTSDSLMFVSESCSLLPLSYILGHIISTLVTFCDFSLIGLMALSSGYMVVLLYRHKRQSQHLHSTHLSSKASPENRASRTILLLMSFFVIMYILDCIVSSYSSGILWNSNPVLYCVQMFVSNGYATISPLLLISTEKRMIKFLTSMLGKNRKCLTSQ